MIAKKHVHYLFLTFLSSSYAFSLIAERVFHITPCKLCYIYRDGVLGVFCVLLTSILISSRYQKWLKYESFLFKLSCFLLLIFSTYQVGVEYKWWEGPASCTRKIMTPEQMKTLSKAEKIEMIKRQLAQSDIVPCNEIRWKILGISANSWNMIALFLLLIVLSL
jgi:disulfide bond formation protein DsbB